MLRSVSALLIALCIPLQSCSQSEPTLPTALPSDAVAVTFDPLEIIGGALMGGPQEAMRTAVRDDQAWESFWAELTATVSPAPPRPTVDFTRDMVIVAAMGMRPTGGYLISVEGVYASGGELYVDVLERSPGVGCVTTQAITSPVTAVKVPARPGPVHFLTREESTPCT